MRWKKNFKAVKNFSSPLKHWKKIFQRQQQNAEKKNYNRYQQNAVKKIFIVKIANLTNLHRANFNAYLTAFNAKGCGRFAMKKIFSPPFTANLTLFFDQTSTRVVKRKLSEITN